MNEPHQPATGHPHFVRVVRVELRLPNAAVELTVPRDEYLLYSITAQLPDYHWPRACEQGWCLACAARLLSGRVDHSDAVLYYPEDEQAGFILLCAAKPLTDLVIEHHPRLTRRAMAQHRLDHNLVVRRFPAPHRRRGPAGRFAAVTSTAGTSSGDGSHEEVSGSSKG